MGWSLLKRGPSTSRPSALSDQSLRDHNLTKSRRSDLKIFILLSSTPLSRLVLIMRMIFSKLLMFLPLLLNLPLPDHVIETLVGGRFHHNAKYCCRCYSNKSIVRIFLFSHFSVKTFIVEITPFVRSPHPICFLISSSTATQSDQLRDQNVIFRHTSVSSTYPCQSVRWSYFWTSITPEHVCARVVFDDPHKVYFCQMYLTCVSSKLCEFIYKQSRRKRYWLLIIPQTGYLLYPEVQIGLKLKCQHCWVLFHHFKSL